jgi:hypothetical protein
MGFLGFIYTQVLGLRLAIFGLHEFEWKEVGNYYKIPIIGWLSRLKPPAAQISSTLNTPT